MCQRAAVLAMRAASRAAGWRSLPRPVHRHLDLDFLAIDDAEIFIEFDGFTVNLPVKCSSHSV